MTAKTRIDRLEQKHHRSTTTAQDAKYLAFYTIMSCEDLAALIAALKARVKDDFDFDLDDLDAVAAEMNRLQKLLKIKPEPSTPAKHIAGILADDPQWEQIWTDRIRDDPETRRSAKSALDRAGMKWPFNF